MPQDDCGDEQREELDLFGSFRTKVVGVRYYTGTANKNEVGPPQQVWAHAGTTVFRNPNPSSTFLLVVTRVHMPAMGADGFAHPRA